MSYEKLYFPSEVAFRWTEACMIQTYQLVPLEYNFEMWRLCEQKMKKIENHTKKWRNSYFFEKKHCYKKKAFEAYQDDLLSKNDFQNLQKQYEEEENTKAYKEGAVW